MNYQTEAAAIRKKLSSYTTHSVVEHLLAHLHQPQRPISQGINVPWIYCLTLEWVLEIKERHNAIEATERCVDKIINRVWNLQNIALKLNGTGDPMIEIRRMIIPQARFQQDHKDRLIFLYRFIAIIELQSGNKTLRNQFEMQAGVSLDDFLLFVTWLWVKLPFSELSFVSYETVINELCPALTPFKVIHLLKLIGGTIPEIQNIIQQRRPSERVLNPSEYFDEPVLVFKPVILLEKGICTPQAHVLSIGVSEFVMRTLKEAEPGRFKDTFTKLYEKYISELVSLHNLEAVNESTIETWYKEAGISGKVADFLIQNDKSSILIDAKGVEPKTSMLTSGSSSYIKDKLKDSLIKGVTQIAECAGKLSYLKKIDVDLENRFGLIVTHQEHFISDAEKLIEFCAGSSVNLREIIEGKMLSKNIMFCTIADLERILNICDATKTSLSAVLKFCADRQSDLKTRRFTFEHHIHEYHQHNGSPAIEVINEMIRSQSDKYIDLCVSTVEQSIQYWGSRHELKAQEFIFSYALLRGKLGI